MSEQHEPTKCSVICPGFGVASETWMYRQVVGLQHLDVQVLTWKRENEEEYVADGVPVHVGPVSPPTGRVGRLFRRTLNSMIGVGRFDGARLETRWLMDRLQPAGRQVVLAHYGTTAVRVLPLCRALNIPVVVHFNGFDASMMLRMPWYRNRLKKNIGKYAAFVVVASYQKERLLALGADDCRVHLIPYGAPMAELGRATLLDREPCRFIMVGRLTEKKRPDLSIRAFASCVNAHPTAALTVIGDGPMRGECIELIQSLRIEKNVTMLGAQPNVRVREEMAKSTVFLQHSVTAVTGDMEGWPVAVAEAAGTGLPVVATRHAGIIDQVEEGRTGLLVEEGDWEGMAEHMIALAGTPDLRIKMGREARAKMSVLGVSNQIARLEDILIQVASRR